MFSLNTVKLFILRWAIRNYVLQGKKGCNCSHWIQLTIKDKNKQRPKQLQEEHSNQNNVEKYIHYAT